MIVANTDNTILDIIKEFGPLTTQEIVEFGKKKKLSIEKEYVHSLLYGPFREVVVRDRNTHNVPT